MAFCLEANEPVENGVKRIVREQVDRVIAAIDNKTRKRDEAVHEVRKCCKRIRAVVRLIRLAFGGHYRFENDFFREAARELSGLRDAKVLVETFDAAARVAGNRIDRRHFALLRRKLVQHCRERAENPTAQDERLATVRDWLSDSRERIDSWTLEMDGFEAVEPGLLKTYASGRKAMQSAYKESGATVFHNWRKRVNYHRYHIRLLRNLWRPVLQPLRHEVKTLARLLGDDHNLAVLRAALTDKPEVFGNERNLQPLLDLIDQQSAALRAEARPLGRRIFAEKPKHLGKRFRAYWTVLRNDKITVDKS
jgi:CHAD domain-containing protein